MEDQSDDPLHHERTLLPRSYISLLSEHNQVKCNKKIKYNNVSKTDAPFTNSVTQKVKEKENDYKCFKIYSYKQDGINYIGTSLVYK